MSPTRLALSVVTALLSLAVGASAYAQPLLVNGSFESGPAIPGGSSFATLSGGSTAITGWTVTGSEIDYIGPGWTVSDGVRAVDLDGSLAIGGIQQTVTTVPGETYLVSFVLSGNPGGAPQVKQVRVSVDSFTQTYAFDTQGQTPSTLTWQPISFSFTASGTSATVSFTSLSPAGNSWGALIDQVSVVSAMDSRLIAISTRALVKTVDDVMIGGFYIGGTAPATVMIRARGPSLGAPPFNNPGVLANPTLQLYSGSTVIAQNDNWGTTDPLCLNPAIGCGGVPEITATGNDPCQPNPGQPGAPPNCAQESAIYTTLPPGGYTAIVRGANGTIGLGLVEVFEVITGASPLVAISTRARVETIDNVMIGGFFIGGTDPKQVLIRGRGPSLGAPPFNNPGVLANPMMQLYSGSTVIAQNDNWGTTDPMCGSPAIACGDAAEIAATQLDPCQPNPGQSAAPSGCQLESAILMTLPPGGFTAIVSGVNATMGMGLVEIFEVAPSTAPQISSFAPTSGPVGTPVTITGQNFDPVAANNIVRFNGILAPVQSATDTTIQTTVPSGATSGPITVTTANGTGTSGSDFVVAGAAPTLTSLSPTSAGAGGGSFSLDVTGSGFASGATVFFGTQALVTTFVSSNSVTATVPAAQIATPGNFAVTATNPGSGPSNAINFQVIGPPVIQSFSPTSGPMGTPVTITGQNFDGIAPNNSLEFNGTTAIITSATPTQITTTVPMGATDGPITVTTPIGTDDSATPFDVTLSGDFALSVGPGAVSVVPGSYRFLSAGATPISGFTGEISLFSDPLPVGISLLFLPAHISPGGASNVELLADSTATPGTYTVTIRGSAQIDGQIVTHSSVLSVQVVAGGTTSLTGMVLSTDNEPIPGVFVTLSNANSTTDAGGSFHLDSVPAGHQMIFVDGRTANVPGRFYPEVVVAADLMAGAPNVMPYIIYLPNIDIAHPINLPVDASGTTTQAFTVTTPAIPNLEINIPSGTRIIDPFGNPVSQITITAVPPDRSPMPLPPGVDMGQLFSIQPGGSSLSRLVPITFPNYLNAEPGTRANLYYFDVTTGTWNLYGQGTVSSDGRQVVPDPGVGIPRFAWHGTAQQTLPDSTPYEQGTLAGDPVDLATGFLTIDKTDLVIPGRLPIAFTRHYHSHRDTGSFPFGRGTGHSYDVQLQFSSGNNSLVLIQGNDTRFRFSRVGTTNTFVSDSSPLMRGAVVTVNANNSRTLRQKDGTVLTFNSTGRLTQQADRNGNVVNVTRDGLGRVLAVGEQSGRQLTFTYDGGNRITEVKDPLGRSVTYHYDASGRLDIVTDPAGGQTRYDYDASYHITTITDARGIAYLQNVYDGNGRVTQQTTADGGVYQYLYFGPNGQAVPTTPPINIVTPRPNCGGGPAVVIPIGMPISSTFSCIVVVVQPGPANFLVSQAIVIDPMGNPTSYRFNSRGFLIEQTNVLGQKTKFTREIGTNRLLSTTDALERTTTFGYDSRENVTSITDPAGNVTQFTYESTFSRLTSIRDALNNAATLQYDASGNLVKTINPLLHETTLAYNAFGQPVSVTDPLGNTAQIEYDGVGNLVATVDPLGNRTLRAYDAVSRLTSLTDSRGFTTQFVYDLLDRVTQITDAMNGVTSFSYDPNGNLLAVTDARNNTTNYAYENNDRLATRTDPLTRQDSYTYDLNGNVKTFRDRKNQVSTFTYDALNRRVLSEYADGSHTSFVFDAVGRLQGTEDSVSGSIDFEYDVLDRLISELTPQGVVEYTYDIVGRRTTMTANGQTPVSYEYDVASRVTQLTQGTQVVSLAYDANGRRTSLAYPNGVNTSYTYDAASRLTGILHQGPTSVIESVSYAYDAAGNRTSFTRGSGIATLLPTAVQAAYDAANEQIRFASNIPNLTYDANGNLVSQTSANGTTTYTWDGRNRLSAISGPGVSANFVYDPLGRRVNKTVNALTTEFQYDQNDIASEISQEAIGISYLLGPEIDERFIRQGITRELYHTDAVGSSLVLTDDAGNGTTVYSYEPFGKRGASGASDNVFQFTGREADISDLYFYRLRYFSPTLHRFLSEDSVGLPGSENLYSYVSNSPANWVDPYGLYLSPWHGLTTFAAMVSCGNSPALSAFIAGTNMGFDFTPGSMSIEKSNEHAMTRPDQSVEDAKEGTAKFIREQLASRTLFGTLGLGAALHANEDRYAHKFEVWTGDLTMEHVWHDLVPSPQDLMNAFKSDKGILSSKGLCPLGCKSSSGM